ncbi:hypothetical protein GCM10022226_31380 [Sphaerisporangium flaviroseum]|uniref:Uncharacterized protein n=1 Tax=Sphaerisporangium flaviroseum TaxID=509199 RepID=A0ABP7I0J1_9ACTN
MTSKIHLWDGKGAGDHRPWRKIAHTAQKRNAPGLLPHLKRMQAQMEHVFDLLDEGGGSTKLTPELCRRFGVDVEPTVVDETHYYVTSPQGEEIVEVMVDIASRGPAARILLVLGWLALLGRRNQLGVPAVHSQAPGSPRATAARTPCPGQ